MVACRFDVWAMGHQGVGCKNILEDAFMDLLFVYLTRDTHMSYMREFTSMSMALGS
ncbi:Beta-lactamase-related domain and Beta-lactamase/transpeptidase-like [Sesbania bispinosa]|nr:Beta-lactamase-related domain and Beta-lactamase/transpeptidase-like [Sesbania bispinosa]